MWFYRYVHAQQIIITFIEKERERRKHVICLPYHFANENAHPKLNRTFWRDLNSADEPIKKNRPGILGKQFCGLLGKSFLPSSWFSQKWVTSNNCNCTYISNTSSCPLNHDDGRKFVFFFVRTWSFVIDDSPDWWYDSLAKTRLYTLTLIQGWCVPALNGGKMLVNMGNLLYVQYNWLIIKG